jgi:RNA polymerase sigma-70 factor (ECF subfamily)
LILLIITIFLRRTELSAESSFPTHQDQTEALYRAHHRWLRAWLRQRLNCSETAADLAHDTFVRLLRRPRKIDNIVAARGYLRTVAERIYIDHWRRRSIEKAWLETVVNRETAFGISEEQHAIIIETFVQIDTLLSNLPGKVAKAFSLSQIEGMTYRQIALELGVSERTVKTYMARAMFECIQLELTHYDAIQV